MNFFDWVRSIFGVRTERAQAPTASPFPAGTGPARLIVIRHAEKTGKKSDPYLSEAGQARAEQLATYIPQTFGAPDFLVAAMTSKKSQRPYDTLVPLAEKLGLEIMEKFDDEEVDALLAHLAGSSKYTGKSGVISWRHSDIPALLAALGAPAGSYPSVWDEGEYRLTFDLRYRGGAAAPTVSNVVQPF